MKKIININLSGRVIPIEDSAYEKLQAYIESLRRYFASEDGRDEIINDIESRVAELMDEKIRKGASAITDADVQEIIASMGTPADFEAQDTEDAQPGATSTGSSSQQQSYTSNSQRPRGRLYRDASDKMLGGVCAGLANYLNLDPAIVRILFAILGFGGFGIMLYILLWIFLPPAELESNFKGKRLYRNPDDRIIGGVASGLAAYFNRSTSTFRLIFAAPIILNILFSTLSWPVFHHGNFVPNIVFGSLTSTFVFVYIVLWIVLPEAISDYQKMEMRGETVDVNTIRQNVREGMGQVKDRLKDWSEEVKESAQRLSSQARNMGAQSRQMAGEARESFRRGGSGIGHAFAVIFKAFFLFIAGCIAFGLFAALVGLLIGGFSVWPVSHFVLDGFWQTTFAWGTVILFLGVPAIGFIVWVLRRLMRVKSRSNYLSWTFGGLWTLGWVSVTLLAASLVNDFRMKYDESENKIVMTQPLQGKLVVTVNEPVVEYSGSLPWVDIDGNGFDINEDSMRLADVRIRVVQSNDDQYHAEISRSGYGETRSEAMNRAKAIAFTATSKDSSLDIASGFSINRENKYRGQHVTVIISVPAGKKIRFDETVEKLMPTHIRIIRKKNGYRREWNWDEDNRFEYRTDIDYTMGADGYLKAEGSVSATTTAAPAPVSSSAASDSIKRAADKKQIQDQIELQKKLIEQQNKENEQRLKELEDKLNKSSGSIRKKDDTDGPVPAGPNAVFSLVQDF